MAYDIARQRVVCFGGRALGQLSDTWEWDGSNWIQRSPATVPSPRLEHAMAYDAGRQRVVMFGGRDIPTSLADTYEWDGNDWLVQRVPPAGPRPRHRHTMAYDVARRRVVMFGGSDYLTWTFFNDTWDWVGNDWIQRSPVTSPPWREGGARAYDIARQRVVLSSGDTWIYGPLTRASAYPLGSACSNVKDQPVLTSDDPFLGNLAFRLELMSARPSSPCLFGLSFRVQDRPIGPCTLWLKEPLTLIPVLSDAVGHAATPGFATPVDTVFRGWTFYAQGFVVDPAANVLGLAFSAGRMLVLGE
jgi:hypothetical protein